MTDFPAPGATLTVIVKSSVVFATLMICVEDSGGVGGVPVHPLHADAAPFQI